jgi:hypothetical protein
MFLRRGTAFAVVDGRLEKRGTAGVCGEGCRFRSSNVEYMCSPAFRMCGCDCCVCLLCVGPRRCLFRVRARVHVHDNECVHASSCHGHTCVGTRKRVSASVALHTPISAVLYRRRCSANYATIAELLVVDDLQPAPPYAPDKTSHAIRHRSPSNRARRISTLALDATQETARYRSAAGQRICSQAAHTLDAKASMT